MRSKRIWGLVLMTSVLGSATALAADETRSYSPPQPLKDDSMLGLHIQRAMTLLATSTPKHHNKVRILFYGQTGADGAGSSGEAFTSKSGRVKIEPGAWFHPNNAKIPVGYEIKWKVLPMFVDSYQAPKVEDETKEYTTTLAQGLPNDKHTLEIAVDGEGVAPIQAIRVYKPPVK